MKKKQKNKSIFDWKYIILIIVGLAAGAGLDIAIRPTEDGGIDLTTGFTIHLSDKQLPALIETKDGEIESTDIVTIEEVETNQLIKECEGECGKGEYIYAPTETPLEFEEYTIGKCWNTDHHYGAQCWDLADLFFQNYAGRNFSTCGTGAAKGAWNCKEYNAGDEFELIYDAKNLQTGDWIIFSSGEYGHVGMAMGSYNNGYISLLGQNQGGAVCDAGGAATNIINISLKSFVGAFRPKSYIKPEPKPEPLPISGCILWHVERGDTMSKIMMECEGTIHYGEIMNEYAKTWYSLIYRPNQSVYDGWNSPSGVGLYAGDNIEHRF